MPQQFWRPSQPYATGGGGCVKSVIAAPYRQPFRVSFPLLIWILACRDGQCSLSTSRKPVHHEMRNLIASGEHPQQLVSNPSHRNELGRKGKIP
jgi:hypothetical protein